MTTMAMAPGLSSPLIQLTSQTFKDKPKRQREKNVSWATEDKLCQVRLFTAEDAPSLSGQVLQELLQAKKTRFMHAVIPVSADDLPPGFEGAAVKCAGLHSVVITAMEAQISWQCPKKFLNDPLWHVAAGGESSEIAVQQQREVRVLEAVYPRPSVIPSSAAEPQEVVLEVEDAQIPRIPLIPVEDEDEGAEEDHLQGGARFLDSLSDDVKSEVKTSPNHLLKDSQNPGPAGQEGGLFNNAEPNIAAAAAAAYAVVKAKESGTLIDHDLLIKILSNPVLIETLTASNSKVRNQSGDSSNTSNPEVVNGSDCKLINEQSVGGSYSVGSHVRSAILPVMQGGHKLDSSFEGRSIQGGKAWDPAGGTRIFPHGKQFHEIKGEMGQVKGTMGTSGSEGRYFPSRQDHLKELIQQHGMVRNSNEAQLRHSTPVVFDETKPDHGVERHRLTVLESRGQQWLGSNQNASSLSVRNDIPRFGIETARIKSRKPCLYFNTPRGCRNGMNCTFLHDTALENFYPERTRTDLWQIQQSKRSKVDSADPESK